MAVHHITLLAAVAVLGTLAAARCPSFDTSLHCKYGYRTRRGCPVAICNTPPYGKPPMPSPTRAPTPLPPAILGCPGAEQPVIVIDPPNPLVPACSFTNPCAGGQICSSECFPLDPTVCLQAVPQQSTTPPPSVGCPGPNDPLPTLGSCSNIDPCEKGQICSSNCRELGIPGFANGGGVCLRGVPLPPRY